MIINAYTTTDDNETVEKHFTLKGQFEGVLREPCSILEPEFDIEYSGIPNSWTHLYIIDFNRWYFINDIVSVNTNLIRVKASVDVLESFHGSRDDETGLYGLTGYVTRNQYYFNPLITDNKYPVKGNPLVTRYTASTTQGNWYGTDKYLRDPAGNNRYFLRMQGETKIGTSSVGTTSPLATVVTDCNGFADLVALIRDNNDIVLSSKTLTEFIYNMGCLPCDIPHYQTREVNQIVFSGTKTLNMPTDDLDHYYYPTPDSSVISTTFRARVLLPSTPTYYLNKAPYTNYSVTFQPFGKLELDPKYFVPDTPSVQADIYFKVKIDTLTGNALLYYGGDSSCPVYLATANVMYSLPLSSTAFNGASLASSAMQVGTGIAMLIGTEGAGAPVALPMIAGGVMSGACAMSNPMQSVTAGDTKIIDNAPVVEVSALYQTLTNDKLFGGLLCEPVALKDLHGYTEISKIHLEGFPATAQEKERLLAILAGGVIFPDP